MSNEKNDTTCRPTSYARKFMDKCHEVQKEKKLMNQTIRRAMDSPVSTFQRNWNNPDPDMHLDLDFAVHASIVIGISLDETLLNSPDTAVPSPVMDNVRAMLVERTEKINSLTIELDELRQKWNTSARECERLAAELNGKNEEIARIQADYIEYIKRMNADLNTCHQQMHELERILRDRDEDAR